MKYITARVRPKRVIYGYVGNFAEKVIKIERVLSFTEEYIFIECPHQTVQTWEYEGGLADIKRRLVAGGLMFA